MDKQKKLRGSIFGGFNKKDVAHYIEEVSKKSNEQRSEAEELRARCEQLESSLGEQQEAQARIAELEESVRDLSSRNETLVIQNAELQSALDKAKAELNSALENAEVYKAAKERFAELEIESSRRAIEIKRQAIRTAEDVRNNSVNNVEEVKANLDNITLEAQRLKGKMQMQIAAFGASIDELGSMLGEKKSALDKCLQDSAQQTQALDE